MPPFPDDTPQPLARRGFLTAALRVTAAGCLAPAWIATGGCQRTGGADEPPGVLRVDIASLEPGERLVVEDGDFPVEIMRTADGVRARSLLCTHQGCVVRWIEFEGEYLCPCHDARFDRDGVPRFGPATRPLRDLPVEIHGGEVHVDLRPVEA